MACTNLRMTTRLRYRSKISLRLRINIARFVRDSCFVMLNTMTLSYRLVSWVVVARRRRRSLYFTSEWDISSAAGERCGSVAAAQWTDEASLW